jgi:hypothetical protein
MNSIPTYYNNFEKKSQEGEPEDMVSWKAWFAASAAALFGMTAGAKANYARELKPIVQKQQFEVAAIPQQTINNNVARISDSLTGDKSPLTEEEKAYVKMLEKTIANNAEKKKKEKKEPSKLDNAVEYIVERQMESVMGNILDGLLGAMFGGD